MVLCLVMSVMENLGRLFEFKKEKIDMRVLRIISFVVFMSVITSCAAWISTTTRITQKANEVMAYYCAKPYEQRMILREAFALPNGRMEIHCPGDIDYSIPDEE